MPIRYDGCHTGPGQRLAAEPLGQEKSASVLPSWMIGHPGSQQSSPTCLAPEFEVEVLSPREKFMHAERQEKG